ncbi:MAG: hypothetical protein AAGH15_09860 [Myxococcota bacterium]
MNASHEKRPSAADLIALARREAAARGTSVEALLARVSTASPAFSAAELRQADEELLTFDLRAC